MFSVIFEVHPKQERFDLYLDLAKQLKPMLETIDGFIDNERFELHGPVIEPVLYCAHDAVDLPLDFGHRDPPTGASLNSSTNSQERLR